MVPSSPCVHIHLLFSDQERHLWLSKCFSQASVCLCAFYQEISPFSLSFPIYCVIPWDTYATIRNKNMDDCAVWKYFFAHEKAMVQTNEGTHS